MKEIWINLLDILGKAWWVEIVTEAPRCTYYFGPFASASDAEAAKPGYIEDLEQEKAQGIKCAVKRCKPDNLTVFDEVSEFRSSGGTTPVFSGQL